MSNTPANIVAEVHSLISGKPLGEPQNLETCDSLPKSVAVSLWSLMRDVTKDGATPDAVKSACNCASEIREMLRFELEYRHLRNGATPPERDVTV